ncbi:MAG TPA: hypothetical protein VHD90_08265 [Phototrophicaceae bacterium]|nr:hypothetical protein [Phototrophicaceae bacterium]
MSVSVHWDNDEQSVLHYVVAGHWTWDEFYDALAEARQMIDASSQQRIHAIIDISEGSLFPKNALLHLRRLSVDTPTKMQFGTTVIVSKNLFVKSLMDVMSHLNPDATNNFQLMATLEEARKLIAQPSPAQV